MAHIRIFQKGGTGAVRLKKHGNAKGKMVGISSLRTAEKKVRQRLSTFKKPHR